MVCTRYLQYESLRTPYPQRFFSAWFCFQVFFPRRIWTTLDQIYVGEKKHKTPPPGVSPLEGHTYQGCLQVMAGQAVFTMPRAGSGRIGSGQDIFNISRVESGWVIRGSIGPA